MSQSELVTPCGGWLGLAEALTELRLHVVALVHRHDSVTSMPNREPAAKQTLSEDGSFYPPRAWPLEV